MELSPGLPAVSRASRTMQLQEKVRLLEEQVKLAEQAELESSRKATNLTSAILSGKVDIVPAVLDPLVACYPTPPIHRNYPTFMKLNPVKVGYVSVIPRVVIHEKLRAWDQSQEIPVELRRLL
jgi:hypothetical protein